MAYPARHASLTLAGASASAHADLLEPLIDSTARQIATLQEAMAALRREQRNYRTGAAGERRTAERVQQVLVDLGASDWHLLADRRWPDTARANIDLILIGPPGVLLLDAKSWADPRIERGGLWRGQQDMREEIDKGLRAADAVAQSLADVGLAPATVKSFIVLVGRRIAALDISGVTVVGELDLPRELVRMGARLDADQIETLVDAVDERCPPAAKPYAQKRRTVSIAPRTVASTRQPVPPPALLDVDVIWATAIETAMREPIESWMTWLHPVQAQLITRRYSGPARVRGAAGTGKTVVALHRARELAKRPGSRVLMTSYVHTLPQVHEALFRRLAPDIADRVEFRSLHSWALRLLRERGHDVDIPRTGLNLAFDTAWATVGQHGLLSSSNLPLTYWRDEITNVIKGRGLYSLDDYRGLVRVGRRTALREEQRRAVWDLYQAYQHELHRAGVFDWADIVSLALESVQRDPVAPGYTAVIVDEVQDLTCVGLRLLHALVGDSPDGLLLVGDGQQSVYPGGFTLPEAGVSVTGRATVLNRNYRNAAEILDVAFAVVRGDMFDDLDESPAPGSRTVDVAHRGGKVVTSPAHDDRSERAELIRALSYAVAGGVRRGDMAVLVPDNRRARAWAKALHNVGVPAILLKDEYDGTTSDQVKVGTYQRAKGLEFACVFLPAYDQAVQPRREFESEDAYRERAELERRRLFVAMTRARDRLWLGSREPHQSR